MIPSREMHLKKVFCNIAAMLSRPQWVCGINFAFLNKIITKMIDELKRFTFHKGCPKQSMISLSKCSIACFCQGRFNQTTVKVRTWMNNHIPRKTTDVITYPCPNPSQYFYRSPMWDHEQHTLVSVIWLNVEKVLFISFPFNILQHWMYSYVISDTNYIIFRDRVAVQQFVWIRYNAFLALTCFTHNPFSRKHLYIFG